MLHLLKLKDRLLNTSRRQRSVMRPLRHARKLGSDLKQQFQRRGNSRHFGNNELENSVGMILEPQACDRLISSVSFCTKVVKLFLVAA
jgi:hypothetical protein